MYNEVKTHYNVPINYDPTRIKFVYPLSEIVFHDGDTAYLQTSLNFASQCESYIIEKRYFIRSCPKSLCAAPHDYQTYFHDRLLLYCRLRISIKVGKNITWDVLLWKDGGMRTTALDDIMAMYFVVSISCSLFREQTEQVEEEEEMKIC